MDRLRSGDCRFGFLHDDGQPDFATLAIAGANDGSTPAHLVRETADLIRGSRFALIRGAGHLPMVEKPRDYADVVAGFLRDIGQV